MDRKKARENMYAERKEKKRRSSVRAVKRGKISKVHVDRKKARGKYVCRAQGKKNGNRSEL